MTTAAARWAADLHSWAIPEKILSAAPESPWHFPTPLFARAAERALAGPPSPSTIRAREALGEGAGVLDVGAGGGAASLPLAPPAALLVAVDESADMLASFAAAAGSRGVPHSEIQGRWPEVAREVEAADVVVCHHVFYNVADLAPFAAALTDHARRRVVVELGEDHPLAPLNSFWEALHGIQRPTSPTAADARAVLAEMGLDVAWEAWERPSTWEGVDRAEVVAFVRRRLCVGPERDPEIDALIGSRPEGPARGVVTLCWEGTAGA